MSEEITKTENAPPTPAREKTKEENVSEILAALAPLAPFISEVVNHSKRHTTRRITLCIIGGLAVLGLCYFAAAQGKWDVVTQITLPILTFFGGLLAGGSK